MLPESLQVRLLTDLTYGKPVQIQDLRKFNEPVVMIHAIHSKDSESHLTVSLL